MWRIIAKWWTNIDSLWKNARDSLTHGWNVRTLLFLVPLSYCNNAPMNATFINTFLWWKTFWKSEWFLKIEFWNIHFLVCNNFTYRWFSSMFKVSSFFIHLLPLHVKTRLHWATSLICEPVLINKHICARLDHNVDLRRKRYYLFFENWMVLIH